MQYKITCKSKIISGDILLDGSKSISNRLLIMNALSETDFELNNLSTSRDTRILDKCLNSNDLIKDAGDAGTAFRFLTAYLAVLDGTFTLTGSDHMKKRPIGELVSALRKLGAEIKYLGRDGYPPLEIGEIDESKIPKKISVDAGTSSQFISALLMIAPYLPNGLTIELKGRIVSMPYIRLTLGLMRQFGVRVNIENSGTHLSVPKGVYTSKGPFQIESDWSAASYYYAMVALSDKATVSLKYLEEESLQGDSVITELMSDLGVETEYSQDGITLTRKERIGNFFEESFRDCPDLAQTIVAACAGLGIPGIFRGLETLYIKETDRVAALQNELRKLNVAFDRMNKSLKRDKSDEAYALQGKVLIENEEIPYFDTYNDHRMAMALTPLVLILGEIIINDPEVVEKSYPGFWADIRKLGFEATEVE